MSNENKQIEPEDRIGLNIDEIVQKMVKSPEILKDSVSKYAKCVIDVVNDEDTKDVWKSMTDNEKSALNELVQASVIMDELFSIQSTGKPLSEWQAAASKYNSTEEKNNNDGTNILSDFIRINIGPWDRLTLENSAKMGIDKQPTTVNFYPSNMFDNLDKSKTDSTASDKDKYEALLDSICGARANKDELIELANGCYSVLSNKTGSMEIIPYKTEYNSYVSKASTHLKNAANYLIKDGNNNDDYFNNKHKNLIDFLLKRSENFINDKYHESDELWIQCDDSVFDVTIGPYEVYEDHILAKKACFESFICLKDSKSSADLQTFRDYLQTLENNLPNVGGDKYFEWKRNNAVKPNYIVAVNQIGRGGDCAGPQTAAFNLPNDENVTKKHGHKLVLLKNVQRLKFNYVLSQINKIAIIDKQQEFVTFDSFFTHILCHEMCHSLGPSSITLTNGKETTVRAELSSNHSSIEEAKADIAGLWSLIYLMLESAKAMKSGKNRNEVAFPDATMFDIVSVLVTFLASAFRSIRFGVHEAHGKGQVIQMNYILAQNGFGIVSGDSDSGSDSDNVRFKVNFDDEKELFDNLKKDKKMEIDGKYIKTVFESIGDCANIILSIQGSGDANKAQKLIDDYATPNKQTMAILEKLKEEKIPVDIYPSYKYA